MDMPKLIPVPIKTKHKNAWVRIWRWITSIRQWRLIEDWEYKLPDDDEPVIVIPKDFIFDGASIPRPLWGVLSPTGLLLIPGLVHDFAYRYDYLWAFDSTGSVYKYKLNSGQRFWDSMFKRVGIAVNGVAFIDLLARLALAGFGRWAWKSNRKRNDPEIRPNKPVLTNADDSAEVCLGPPGEKCRLGSGAQPLPHKDRQVTIKQQ